MSHEDTLTEEEFEKEQAIIEEFMQYAGMEVKNVDVSKRDFYAQHFIYSYFIPEEDILFLVDYDNLKWGTIRNDGGATLDNILDYTSERCAITFFAGTFKTAFDKAKGLYEEGSKLCMMANTHDVYPHEDQDLYVFTHKETYSFLSEMKNSMDDETKSNW